VHYTEQPPQCRALVPGSTHWSPNMTSSHVTATASVGLTTLGEVGLPASPRPTGGCTGSALILAAGNPLTSGETCAATSGGSCVPASRMPASESVLRIPATMHKCSALHVYPGKHVFESEQRFPDKLVSSELLQAAAKPQANQSPSRTHWRSRLGVGGIVLMLRNHP